MRLYSFDSPDRSGSDYPTWSDAGVRVKTARAISGWVTSAESYYRTPQWELRTQRCLAFSRGDIQRPVCLWWVSL